MGACVYVRDALTGAPLRICVVVRNSLHTLFRIFKGLIMLNEPSLIEACLSDAFFLDTMGYFFCYLFILLSKGLIIMKPVSPTPCFPPTPWGTQNPRILNPNP